VLADQSETWMDHAISVLYILDPTRLGHNASMMSVKMTQSEVLMETVKNVPTRPDLGMMD